MYRKISILLIIPLFFGFALHKFHLSNTKVVYNTKEKSLQITMRCFVDDIENSLNKSNKILLELGNDRELKDANQYLKDYLLNNFKVEVNHQNKEIIYLGKEIEKNIIYFYLEIDSVSNISSIRVENKVLFESFNDQQNVVRLQLNDTKKTFVLKENNFVGFFKL